MRRFVGAAGPLWPRHPSWITSKSSAVRLEERRVQLVVVPPGVHRARDVHVGSVVGDD